jgi:hypothetical protein
VLIFDEFDDPFRMIGARVFLNLRHACTIATTRELSI